MEKGAEAGKELDGLTISKAVQQTTLYGELITMEQHLHMKTALNDDNVLYLHPLQFYVVQNLTEQKPENLVQQ